MIKSHNALWDIELSKKPALSLDLINLARPLSAGHVPWRDKILYKRRTRKQSTSQDFLVVCFPNIAHPGLDQSANSRWNKSACSYERAEHRPRSYLLRCIIIMPGTSWLFIKCCILYLNKIILVESYWVAWTNIIQRVL